MPDAVNQPDDAIARATSHYQPAQLSPAEFELFVASLFESLASTRALSELRVENHEVIRGVDGAYDFDATVRFDVAGMEFLILVEAKCHRNPIKRELVQVLHQKLQSVGAQKAVLVSTAPFQSGALEFALAHGIALVTVTEGRFTYETKSAGRSSVLSRAEAAAYGLPIFVGHGYSRGDSPGSVRVTVMSPEYPEYLAEHFLPSQ
ncbi:restriction endonuclease [Tessaracoccus lapidicaptus]|uniref:restriction endonuclease n=1 Tax=Tessaracoccus lapidicaptus TaxID=1427523 RepID=UPI0033429AE8